MKLLRAFCDCQMNVQEGMDVYGTSRDDVLPVSFLLLEGIFDIGRGHLVGDLTASLYQLTTSVPLLVRATAN